MFDAICYVKSLNTLIVQGLFRSQQRAVDKVSELRWKWKRNAGYARHAELRDLQRAPGLLLPLTISLPLALRRLSGVSGDAVGARRLVLRAEKERQTW